MTDFNHQPVPRADSERHAKLQIFAGGELQFLAAPAITAGLLYYGDNLNALRQAINDATSF
jgi:hypothetical protein